MLGGPFALSFRHWRARFLNSKPARRLRTRLEVKNLEERMLPDAAPTEFFNLAALDGRWRTAPAASGDTTGVTDTANLQNPRVHTVELVDFTGGGNAVVASVTVNTLGATPG